MQHLGTRQTVRCVCRTLQGVLDLFAFIWEVNKPGCLDGRFFYRPTLTEVRRGGTKTNYRDQSKTG